MRRFHVLPAPAEKRRDELHTGTSSWETLDGRRFHFITNEVQEITGLFSGEPEAPSGPDETAPGRGEALCDHVDADENGQRNTHTHTH